MALFRGGLPNANHLALYSRWADGGWGMIMTGNVQVSKDHLSLGRDMVVPEELTPVNVEPFTRLAETIHGKEERRNPPEEHVLAIMQLCHAGRQSPSIIGGRSPFTAPLAPSAVPLDFHSPVSYNLGGLLSSTISSLMHQIMFPTPRAMSLSDIDAAINAFVRGAELAARSGFDGIELHAGHGCECRAAFSCNTFRPLKENNRSRTANATHFLQQT